jgi:energy-coupling factor transporter ATP-binding protein EcfA2
LNSQKNKKLSNPLLKPSEELRVANYIFSAVEKTHKGCGRLALMETLCDIGNRCLLVVGSSGTGKSATLRWLSTIVSRDKLWKDAITISGLKYLEKILSGQTKTILIDDISKAGTSYSQVMTVTCIGELVYSGFISKTTSQMNIDISGFRGSAIINCQPLIYKRIVKADEFETDIRDKVIRYFHIRRPIQITIRPPENHITYTYNYYDITLPEFILNSPLYEDTLEVFRLEFTKARAKEHLNVLLQASALLNNRPSVVKEDVCLVNWLSRTFLIESYITNKTDLEGARDLDVNILPILSVIATYGKYRLTDLSVDFQVKLRRAYEIVKMNEGLVTTIFMNGETYVVPTNACRDILKMAGEWEEEDEQNNNNN